MSFCGACGSLTKIRIDDGYKLNCDSCGTHTLIPDGTILFSKSIGVSLNNNITSEQIERDKLDLYARRTEYNCSNKNCDTHNVEHQKNNTEKFLVLVRNDKSYNICSVCNTKQDTI